MRLALIAVIVALTCLSAVHAGKKARAPSFKINITIHIACDIPKYGYDEAFFRFQMKDVDTFGKDDLLASTEFILPKGGRKVVRLVGRAIEAPFENCAEPVIEMDATCENFIDAHHKGGSADFSKLCMKVTECPDCAREKDTEGSCGECSSASDHCVASEDYTRIYYFPRDIGLLPRTGCDSD